MKKLLLVSAIWFSVWAIVISIVGGVKSVRFTNGCTAYLRLAANSPTIERADMFLSKALEYIDKNDLNIGNSSLLIERPTNDLEIWSKQLRITHNVLSKLIDDPNTDQLTKDNALMKIREVIMNDTAQGDEINLPDLIAFVPWQAIFVLLIPLCWLFAILFWFWWAIEIQQSE